MNKIFKNRSIILGITALLQIGINIWILLYFNHLDHLMYYESGTDTSSLALLIQNMYTSTWWALIILAYTLVSIFTLTSFIYKDLKFEFISIILYVVLLLLAINFKDTLKNNISSFLIFIPLIALNIASYKSQKKISLYYLLFWEYQARAVYQAYIY